MANVTCRGSSCDYEATRMDALGGDDVALMGECDV